MGTKKTLYFLHETDDRIFVLIGNLLSLTTHRPTFLFDTGFNNLHIVAQLAADSGGGINQDYIKYIYTI